MCSSNCRSGLCIACAALSERASFGLWFSVIGACAYLSHGSVSLVHLSSSFTQLLCLLQLAPLIFLATLPPSSPLPSSPVLLLLLLCLSSSTASAAKPLHCLRSFTVLEASPARNLTYTTFLHCGPQFLPTPSSLLSS